MNDNVRSAARVLDLLELLSEAEEGLSLAHAAEGLGAPKSSTLMLLRTLTARGYALRGEDDRYRLHPVFVAKGFGWGGRAARLVGVAEPVLRGVADRIGETVILGVLTRIGSVRLVAKAVAPQDIRYDIELGREVPAYCTATGRVLLAGMAADARAALLDRIVIDAVTDRTTTDRASIEEKVAAAGEAGLSIVSEEFAIGGTGIAVPVTLSDGSVIAALNAGCVTPRLTGREDGIVAALREGAATIAARFEHRGVA